MKKLLLFLILLHPLYSLSQDSERVLEIERMYSKIIMDEINTECYEVQWKNKNLRAYAEIFVMLQNVYTLMTTKILPLVTFYQNQNMISI